MTGGDHRTKSGLVPEFNLALACCKCAFSAAQAGAADPGNIDWHRFARLVEFHRIEGFAAACLAANQWDAPDDVRQSFATSAERIAAQNLQAAADCRTILEAFDAASVPLLFLKGLSLGSLAYEDPATKSAIDIDLLIAPADVYEAAKLLRACGYELAAPAKSNGDAGLANWHQTWKESVWTKADPPLQVDLHTRLTDNARLLSPIDVNSPKQGVEIGNGIRLPTLADEELFAYLAVHGAWSAWFRLKWISDFAGLLNGRTGEEIEFLYRRSLKLGAGRASGQALLLADALFDTLRDSPQLKAELLRNRPVRRLYQAALQLLTREPREPTDSILGSLPIRLTEFFLLPGLGFKISELSGQVRRLFDRPQG